MIVVSEETLMYLRCKLKPGVVAHAYNPSYSGGRDQEDHSWKPAGANSSRDPISKKAITHTHTQTHTLKRVEWLKV
jgi:hypothetical protein